MDEAEADLRRSSGFQKALKEGLTAVAQATFDAGGQPLDGRIEFYHADGSSFSRPVIAGSIVDDSFEAMKARQKIINDVHDKVIDLSPDEYSKE